ncbi:hypothetical protein CRI94_08365 [Longibacter salinarum]|uniref:Uncharacterized protein n=1 Tax=Longibacter salinarum TaxID=1850348 RepID=A0A2A8CZN9_9BACT|nr:hypothetical protein [Longibacter salinarum]PEN14047.1 hypothetical protein CRI94_08365 [Longibacter salinarum]
MLPEWAPNLLVFAGHAPLVLLATGLVIDLFVLLRPKWDAGPAAATSVYVAAGVAAVIVYLAGPDAVASVYQVDGVTTVFEQHVTFRWYTLLFATIYGLVRLGLSFLPAVQELMITQVILVLVAAGGIYLSWQTTTAQAELVHRYGVGVQPVAEVRQQQAEEEEATPQGFTEREDAWSWTPTTPGAWKDAMTWVDGAPTDVQSFIFQPEGDGPPGLALYLRDATVLFTAPVEMRTADIRASLNVDAFDGTVSIVHNVRGAAFYDYLQLDENRLRLARREGSAVRVQDAADYGLQGWRSYRLIVERADRSGFVGDQMVVSGSDTPASPGTVGLRLSGTGLVRLRSMAVQPIPVEATEDTTDQQ